MDMASGYYLPIASAYTGQRCTHCCERGDDKLLRCTSCKLACYCSRECQKKDWPHKHKMECKLLQMFQQAYSALSGPAEDPQAKVLAFGQAYPTIWEHASQETLKQMPRPMQVLDQTPLRTRFLKFVMHGRSCSICLANDFSGPLSTDPKLQEEYIVNHNKLDWKCCPTCQHGWCCSSRHWEEHQEKHTPEICQRYTAKDELDLFHYRHVQIHKEVFRNAPRLALADVLEVFPKDWDAYFRTRFVGRYPEWLDRLPPQWYPATTRLLSQPVTCLYAMYQYGIHHFSEKQELTLHIVGAEVYELPATGVWEEILHCLPRLQQLTIQFIGPHASKASRQRTRDSGPQPVDQYCPDCTQKGRKWSMGIFGYTYHGYVETYLQTTPHDHHSKPDLIVAFNTGMSEEHTDSWKTSLEVILDMNVPAYFTAYCEEEAVLDYELLEGVQAHLLQSGPEQNPFAEDYMNVEPASIFGVDKFFTNNMYGVLFQGRTKES